MNRREAIQARKQYIFELKSYKFICVYFKIPNNDLELEIMMCEINEYKAIKYAKKVIRDRYLISVNDIDIIRTEIKQTQFDNTKKMPE